MRMTTVLAGLFILAVSPAWAADLTVDEVRRTLAAATPGKPADFSGKSLEKLVLSNLDLSGANFANANMHGVKLDGARLRGANLSGAILNLAWVMRADFTDANLSGASFQGPCPTGCSPPTKTYSPIAASLGPSLSISPGASCLSVCEIGPMRPDQRDLV